MKKLEKKKAKEAKENNDNSNKQSSSQGTGKDGIAEKLYTEIPETSFTRSISNPEAVMRRRRQQKLEKKLQQLCQEGGPEAGQSSSLQFLRYFISPVFTLLPLSCFLPLFFLSLSLHFFLSLSLSSFFLSLHFFSPFIFPLPPLFNMLLEGKQPSNHFIPLMKNNKCEDDYFVGIWRERKRKEERKREKV